MTQGTRALTACAGILLFVVVGCGSPAPLEVGAVLSMTGPGQSIGEMVLAGLELAAEEINDAGGVQGRPVELLVRDSKSDPAVALEVYRKMLEDHNPVACFSTLSSVGAALSMEAEATENVLVTLVTSDPAITQDKDWTFRFWTSNEEDTRAAADLIQNLDPGSLLILYVDDNYGTSHKDLLIQNLNGRLQSGLVTQSFRTSDLDFSEVLENHRDTDLIYMAGFPLHFVALARQANEAGYAGYLVTNTVLGANDVIQLPESEGAYGLITSIHRRDSILASNVRERFERSFGQTFTQHAGSGYDSLILVSRLLVQTELTSHALRDELDAGFVHPGIFGEIQVGAGVRDITFPLYAAQIRDGQFVYR